MGELNGKFAVITGAGSGMGRASAKVFAREGARVLAVDISGREKETAAELGSAVLPFHCDVSKEAQVAAMIEAAVKEFGRVDAVLNVAGIAGAAPLAELDMSEYDRMMDVDLRGVIHGTKHGIRAMVQSGGGVIINWSSLAAFGASMMTAAYSAAKAGVVAVTKAAALEYGPQGIRANALCPGFILTEMSAGAEQFMPELPKKAALKRAGQAHEVAEVAAFLASDRASYVSGAIIPIDGGWSAQLA
ncbi:MAG: SDR family NAD(P)-dependent oxidoreductase [bacterium]